MTPNSSVFGHCVNFGLLRLNAFRRECHVSICRGPRTKHVRGLLLRCGILDSLCWRVLDCFSNQPVHIWLPRSVARKNNHRHGRSPREPSDWQAVENTSPLQKTPDMLCSWAAADTGMASPAKCIQTHEPKIHAVPKKRSCWGSFCHGVIFILLRFKSPFLVL